MTAYRRLIPLLLLLCSVPFSGCQNQHSASSATSHPQTTTPVPRTKEFPWMSVSRWYEMHAEDVNIARTKEVDLLFVGDSITESWDWGDGRDEVYRRHFGEYQAANFGVGGDMTQNLLWRLQHNLQGNLAPSAVVLMIGVNNFLQEQHSPEAVAAGVKAVVAQIQQNYPKAKLLIIGVLPFHQNADNPSRETVAKVNRLIAELEDQKRVFYTNVNHLFLNDEGEIPQPLMDDYIHPSAAGLEIIAQDIAPLIKKWLANDATSHKIIKAGDVQLQVMGRTAATEKQQLVLGYPGATVRFKTNARSVTMRASSDHGRSYVDIQIDDQAPQAVQIPVASATIELMRADDNSERVITLQNRSETWHGTTTIDSFIIEDGDLLPLPPLPQRKILVVGDSITCGDAIDRPKLSDAAECNKDNSWWNARQTFGMRLGSKLNAQVHLVCYGGRGLIRTWDGKTDQMNAPNFYEYAIASDDNPTLWDQSQFHPDLAIISLGTNDFSENAGPILSEQAYTSAYMDFINKIQRDHNNIEIIITDGPLVNDGDIKRKTILQNYLSTVASKTENVTFVPAAHYPGDRCDFHPNSEQHQAIANDLLPEIKKLMKWDSAG